MGCEAACCLGVVSVLYWWHELHPILSPGRCLTVIAVGIDCTSGRQAFTYAVLDSDLRVVSLAELEVDDLLQGLESWGTSAVAVNSPSNVNAGVVRRRAEAKRGVPGSIRGTDLREAEYDLHGLGIPVGATPRMEALCAGWVQLGLALYRRLRDIGFTPYPAGNATKQWLETHPHAGFCALLGRPPLPRPTLEGRLQRALALFERGVRIPDPMAFLEEITRHRLLHGLLPIEQIPTQEQLDALLAAYTAWLAIVKPRELTQVGNRQEGFITLPVPQLLEKYATA
jgi:hypothetical protein